MLSGKQNGCSKEKKNQLMVELSLPNNNNIIVVVDCEHFFLHAAYCVNQ